LLRKLLTLIHPAAVRKGSVDLRMTWAMGTLAFFFFLEMVVTGALLMFSYRPTLDDAYLDVLQLQASPSILRPLHRWGASALLITLILHLFRVFLTGTYKAPRQANWMIGVVLLVLTIVMSTTGSLLPMDQQAFWSLTVGRGKEQTAMLPGDQDASASPSTGSEPATPSTVESGPIGMAAGHVDGSTLGWVYVLHCLVLPATAAILIAVHLRRIRKDDGSVVSA
jgi:quinol-cytochrome oxidoreductase complex cytochrome b subunit